MQEQYRVLSEDDKDDIIVEFLLAQERDLFCHKLNLERYSNMLRNLPPGKFQQYIAGLKSETEQRIAEVESIINATLVQLPPPERIENAKMRIAAKMGRIPQV